MTDLDKFIEGLVKVKYPEPPKKPYLSHSHTSEAALAYANQLAEYEMLFQNYKEQLRLYRQNEDANHELIKDFIIENVLMNIPEQYREKLWHFAWNREHGSGYNEVCSFLDELTEIFE